MVDFENFTVQIKSIIRTRRRAFALISGVMLATMILSGIILYSSVLQQRNFEGIVGDTAYELTFNKFNNEQFEVLNDLGSDILSNDKIDDYATIGGRNAGNPTQFFQDSDYNIALQVGANGTYSTVNSRNQQTMRPMYVDGQFFASSIGQSITKLFYDGDFRLPTVNETIIPRAVASELGLEIGDTINRANVTISNDDTSQNLFATTSVSNLTVIGIYDQPSQNVAAGGFGPIGAFEYLNLILNQDLLETPSFSEYNDIMVQAGHFTLLVSIVETQFSVSDPELFVQELDQLMNEITENYDDPDLIGYNLIASTLQNFTIFSIIVAIMYIIISIPVIILSLYVLNYGLTVSLEERKREIAIKKVQGASGSQIFKEIRNESLLIYLMGVVLGYFLATFVAYVIGNSVGFFEFDLGTLGEYLDYIEFNLMAILVSAVITGLMLIFVVYRTGKKFIEQEVSSSIAMKQDVEHGFLRSTNLDVIFFLIGLVGFSISFAQQVLLWEIEVSVAVFLFQLGGSFLIWIGGAVVGSRIVGFVPRFLEPIYLKLFIFKDVSRIIKAGLRRRGDTNKLAIVIILSLAVASMAVIQGVTDEAHVVNDIEYQVGSDFKVETSTATDIVSSLQAINGVERVQPILKSSGRILSSTIRIAGLDPTLELEGLQEDDPIMNWERNSFEELSPVEALEILEDNPRGIFITSNLEFSTRKSPGDLITISIPLVNPTINQSEVAIEEIEILGIVNLLPGQLQTFTLTSAEFVEELTKKSLAQSDSSSLPLQSNQYQIDLEDESLTSKQISDFREAFLGVTSVSIVTSLQAELNEIEASGTGFGLTGLLTLSAAVSLLATFISSFAFSSIIMERRKREFAVIRAIGARKSQIYKMAIGENFLMMLIGVIWGILIGIAVGVIFNGFFGVISGELLRSLTVSREIVFPWVDLAIFGGLTLAGMMVATVLSIRHSVNADLTQATRAE